MARISKTALTEKQRNELAQALREKQEQLRERQVTLDEERIVEAAPDHLDTANDAVAEHDVEALSAHDTWLLGEIAAALTRLAQGRYGLSVESGEPIPYARLRSIPWARRTAEEEEEVSRTTPQALR